MRFHVRVRVALLVLVLLAIDGGSGLLRRCFSCRSRGELGDCRDPFLLSTASSSNNNESPVVVNVEGKRDGVETPPCSSGWCSKILENVDKGLQEDADHGTATQRDCLQSPPSDGQERCAFVTLNRRKVFMCFCKGDLCNAGHSLKSSVVMTTVAAFFLTTVRVF